MRFRYGLRSVGLRPLEAWQRHYNNERPHGSLGNLAPSEFAKEGQKSMAEEYPDFLVTIGTEKG